MWFAYFGSLDTVDQNSFLGAPVDKVYYVGPCWQALGLTLLVNQYGGRLFLQVTYLPDCVSESTVERFLDAVIADLSGGWDA